MQIYRFSLIFHSISELNKEKQPDFAKIFAGDGRRIIKVGVNFSEDFRVDEFQFHKGTIRTFVFTW